MPPRSTWSWLVDAALREDLGAGDATSRALIPEGMAGSARLETAEALVIAGLQLAQEVFERNEVSWEVRNKDTDWVSAGTTIARVHGPAAGILAAERTALNFLEHLSGIATHTRRYCQAVRGTRAQIVDTRKTLPGWRTLAKFAVRCGGGVNHRMGLYDGILIKDNHISALGSVEAAVKRAQAERGGDLGVQIEVESLEQAQQALEAGADALLVDNQTPEVIATIVELVGARIPVEASGGITLSNVRAIAETGVDRISIGALTHSASAVDIRLEWDVCSTN